MRKIKMKPAQKLHGTDAARMKRALRHARVADDTKQALKRAIARRDLRTATFDDLCRLGNALAAEEKRTEKATQRKGFGRTRVRLNAMLDRRIVR